MSVIDRICWRGGDGRIVVCLVQVHCFLSVYIVGDIAVVFAVAFVVVVVVVVVVVFGF